MVNVNLNISKDANDAVKELGFSSIDEFIQDAVQKRLLEIKKMHFCKISDEVRRAMVKKNISESDILSDFERVKHES